MIIFYLFFASNLYRARLSQQLVAQEQISRKEKLKISSKNTYLGLSTTSNSHGCFSLLGSKRCLTKHDSKTLLFPPSGTIIFNCNYSTTPSKRFPVPCTLQSIRSSFLSTRATYSPVCFSKMSAAVGSPLVWFTDACSRGPSPADVGNTPACCTPPKMESMSGTGKPADCWLKPESAVSVDRGKPPRLACVKAELRDWLGKVACVVEVVDAGPCVKPELRDWLGKANCAVDEGPCGCCPRRLPSTLM